MSSLRKEHKGIVAVLCSDIHLCHKVPIARSVEKDWYAVMARSLMELNAVATVYDVPIVCAGDIFDHWKSPPELVNFALKYLPKMYAIPGQHDLPFHSMQDIHKSAYWTLVEAGKIENLPSVGIPLMVSEKLWLHGFAWNVDPVPFNEESTWPMNAIHLAVVHAYNWTKNHTYPGAPPTGTALKWQRKLAGYTASVFGDNHKGFMFGDNMMNCGTFMRRKIDEMNYSPQIGLLNKWGRIIPYYLDTEKDQFIDRSELEKLAEKGLEMGTFLAELAGLGDTTLNFFDALTRFCTDNGIDKHVKKIILEAMEKK